MAEHGFNRVDESPTPSRGHFLALVGFGLLAVAGGAGGGLLADRLWPPAPAQLAPATDADDGYAAAPGTTIKVEGRIIAVNAAAGTITVQDDDGPPIVVALGAARGPYYVWQKVKVYGIVSSVGSNGATVQAQFIRLKSWDGDDDDDD
jgi:hypothetical protein